MNSINMFKNDNNKIIIKNDNNKITNKKYFDITIILKQSEE